MESISFVFNIFQTLNLVFMQLATAYFYSGNICVSPWFDCFSSVHESGCDVLFLIGIVSVDLRDSAFFCCPQTCACFSDVFMVGRVWRSRQLLCVCLLFPVFSSQFPGFDEQQVDKVTFKGSIFSPFWAKLFLNVAILKYISAALMNVYLKKGTKH